MRRAALLTAALLLLGARAHADGMGMAIVDGVLRTGLALVGTFLLWLLTLAALIVTLVRAARVRSGQPVRGGRPSPSRAPFVLSLVAFICAVLWQLAVMAILPRAITWIYVGTLLNLAVAAAALVKAWIDLARGRRQAPPAADSPPG